MRKEKVHILHGAIGHYSDWTAIEKSIHKLSMDTNAHDLYKYLGSNGYNDFIENFEENVLLKDNEPNHSLMGYSMGGRLALHALIAMPSHWSKVMIVSAHTGFPNDATELRESRLKGDEEWAHLASDPEVAWADFLEKWNAQGVLQLDSEDSLGWADRSSLEDYRLEIADSFRQWSLGRQIDTLERLPRCELHIVKDAGHRVPWEQAEAFQQIVCDWLS